MLRPMRVRIDLPVTDWNELLTVADEELRPPAEQAAFLVRNALRRRRHNRSQREKRRPEEQTVAP